MTKESSSLGKDEIENGNELIEQLNLLLECMNKEIYTEPVYLGEYKPGMVAIYFFVQMHDGPYYYQYLYYCEER